MTGEPASIELNEFIVRAKAAAYAGGGPHLPSSCRPGSHDLAYEEGPFAYLDSYFGTADFIGQEVIYYQGRPVWAMNYYGRILAPEAITPAETIEIIKKSLSALYRTGRFLGGFEFKVDDALYTDTNEGDVTAFTGREWIARGGRRVYELVYHGGMIK